MGSENPGFGVYVHWPFCRRICPYCDFNVHEEKELDAEVWRAALLSELAHYAGELGGRTVTSLYFGGGTPSLIEPETVGEIVQAVAGHWPVADGIEITLETNPTSSERDRLRDFRTMGVNRLSLGIQSFDDDALEFLGRDHSARDAIATLENANSVFERVTFDLIYARPNQSLSDWKNELDRAVQIAGGHLSLYQLTIESGTPFFRDGVHPADDDTAADMFETTQEILSAAGMPAYEISNHAKRGEESRHNLTCWRGGDYLGIGPGAHGRLTIDGAFYGTHQIHNPDRWLQLAIENGHGTAKRRLLETDDRARELIMMGLRLVEGVDTERFNQITGLAFDEVVDPDALARLIENELMTQTAASVYATESGRQRLNAVLGSLLG